MIEGSIIEIFPEEAQRQFDQARRTQVGERLASILLASYPLLVRELQIGDFRTISQLDIFGRGPVRELQTRAGDKGYVLVGVEVPAEATDVPARISSLAQIYEGSIICSYVSEDLSHGGFAWRRQ